MKKVEFNQVNVAKSSIFALAYVALLLFILSAIFGFDEIVNYVNSFSGSKAKIILLGLLVGVIGLSPIILLKKFLGKYLGDKNEILINNDVVEVKKNGKLKNKTSINTIESLVFKDLSTKTLDIYKKGGEKFVHIRPLVIANPTKQLKIINEIIDLFKEELNLQATEETRTKGSFAYKSVTYYRKS